MTRSAGELSRTDGAAGRGPRVAIVGGGLAGMSAAESLARSGVSSVTIFEARRTTGGRAGSFVDPQTGESVDYCQHVAMGCCTNLLAMLDDCGLADQFDRHDRLSFHHPDVSPSRFEASRFLPPPLHLLPALGRLRYLTLAQRWQVIRGTARLMRQSTLDLRSISAADWLREAGQSPATIADYWDVVIVSALGESSRTASMAAARKVFVDGFLAARGASDVWIPRLPLSELFGRRLPATLERLGVELRPGVAIRSVRLAGDSADGTTIGGKSADEGGLWVEWAAGYRDGESRAGAELASGSRIDGAPFDQVIVAVPWHRIARVIDAELALQAGLDVERWATCPASPISGVHLWFDRRITSAAHAVLVGTLSQWLFCRPGDLGTSAAETPRHYYQVVISASRSVRHQSQDAIVEQVVRELQAAFPKAGSARLLAARVVTDPFSVFSISPEVDACRPVATTDVPGLHLAGDFLQTGWPATMEGAVISGRMAANSVLRSLGRPQRTIDRGLPWGRLSRWLIRHDRVDCDWFGEADLA